LIQVLWHGRGGQGAFTAARLLGGAWVLGGGHALAVPSFGPERRGAPMRAFTKLGEAPVVGRSEVRPEDASYIVYLDETLYGGEGAGAGRGAAVGSAGSGGARDGAAAGSGGSGGAGDGEGGASRGGEGGGLAGAGILEAEGPGGARVLVATPATRGFAQSLGLPTANTLMLGALARRLGIPQGRLDAALEAVMPERLWERNKAAIGAAMRLDAVAPAGTGAAAAAAAPDAAAPDGAPSAAAAGPGAAPAAGLSPFPADVPEATAFRAGYLVTANAGWRSQRPLVDPSACARCMRCYLYCPDGAISPAIEVDYAFCKGCGVCAKACRPGAIRMAPEAGQAAPGGGAGGQQAGAARPVGGAAAGGGGAHA
jgi:pyruvate ferredoxin oxidoreductase gamma subunit